MIIDEKLISRLKNKYNNNSLITNAVANNNLNNISLNNKIIQKDHSYFNYNIKQNDSITNQENTGRCWLFAVLNNMRLGMIEKYKLKNFEFSYVYLSFWDKLEKCNTILNYIEQTKHLNINSRIVSYLLGDEILSDGGNWHMIKSLINKYGLIPNDAMKETSNSNNTNMINNILNIKLKIYTKIIRENKTYSLKNMIAEIYKLLVYFFGEPPNKINWKYKPTESEKKSMKNNKKTKKKTKKHTNKTQKNVTTALDKKVNIYSLSKKKKDKLLKCKNLNIEDANMTKEFDKGISIYNITPLQFYNNIVPYDVNRKVVLINDPNKKYYKMYDIKYNKNIINGYSNNYINVPLNIFKQTVMKSIKNKESVWFSADVEKDYNSNYGIMNTNIYNKYKILNTKLSVSKKDNLRYNISRPNHAMLFTGIYLNKKNKPIKWLVENSWGTENNKGMIYMFDNWFDKYVYQVIIDKKYLSKTILDIANKKDSIKLDPWDRFGNVAI